jgi:hypothetical protein
VDFEKINSIDGTFIANVYDPQAGTRGNNMNSPSKKLKGKKVIEITEEVEVVEQTKKSSKLQAPSLTKGAKNAKQ